MKVEERGLIVSKKKLGELNLRYPLHLVKKIGLGGGNN